MNFIHIVPPIFTLFWVFNEGCEGTNIVSNNGTAVNVTLQNVSIYIQETFLKKGMLGPAKPVKN